MPLCSGLPFFEFTSLFDVIALVSVVYLTRSKIEDDITLRHYSTLYISTNHFCSFVVSAQNAVRKPHSVLKGIRLWHLRLQPQAPELLEQQGQICKANKHNTKSTSSNPHLFFFRNTSTYCEHASQDEEEGGGRRRRRVRRKEDKEDEEKEEEEEPRQKI